MLVNTGEPIEEDKNYQKKQLITYLGSKRRLLNFIESAVDIVKKDLKQDKLSILDGFSGSGIVSRMFKKHAFIIYSNDMEYYAYVIGKCFLSNKEDVPSEEISNHLQHMNNIALVKNPGFIQELYAPKDENDIKLGERVFFTPKNALIIDNSMSYIHSDAVPSEIRPFLLAPLMSDVSIRVNTGGVFRGFYKNSVTHIGQFGGDGRNSTERMFAPIQLNYPVLSNFSCKWHMFNQDTNSLLQSLPEIDLAYYDPPYKSHSYGANYFMLNLIAENRRPENITKVAGVPPDWKRSDYYKTKQVEKLIEDLAKNTPAKYIALSYSNEGAVACESLRSVLSKYGAVSIAEQDHGAYGASRHFKARAPKVKEMLFLLKKS